jgi:hypothetical protein
MYCKVINWPAHGPKYCTLSFSLFTEMYTEDLGGLLHELPPPCWLLFTEYCGRKMDCKLWTVYSVLGTVQDVDCTLWVWEGHYLTCPPPNTRCTVYCVNCHVYCPRGGLYTAGMGGSLPDLPTPQYTVYCVLCKVSCVLYERWTVHCRYGRVTTWPAHPPIHGVLCTV